MKRKIFALMLVFALALTVLSGCEGIANNGGSSGGGAEDAAGDTGDSADAGADANADTGADAGAVTGDFEPMELSVSMSTNEVESPAKVFKTFADGVTEKTGGAVTFNIYYGSTFCGPQEELYQIQSGSLDMCILQTLAYGDVLPLLVSIPQMWPGDDAGAKNYFDTIFVDDPETSKYIGDSLSAFNVHSIGNIYTGLNCYFSTKEFKTFDDLKGLKIGCQDSAPLDGLGLSGVYVDVPDYYDSLERGVVDGGTFSFDGLVALKLYEPAPNVMLDTGKTWGMPFCIRNDLWDSFSPELQQIFNDSMAAAQEYGVELVNENIELSKGSLAEQGATVGTLSEEDSQRSFEAQLVASIASGMKRAKEAGVEDQMLALEKKALELYGLDETKYLAEYE